jgi:hypothetical protein
MLLRFSAVALLVVLSVRLTAAPAVPLADLVDERTLVAVCADDVPSLLRGWDASPLAATWRDPQFVRFLAPLRAEMKIDEWDERTREATGLSVSELLALARGEALLAIPSLAGDQIESQSETPFLAAIEVGSQAEKIEASLAESAAKKNIEETTEIFAGVTVHTLTAATPADDVRAGAKPFVWAITDGIWLFGIDRERVLAAIDAVKQGGLPDSLGRSEGYQRTRRRVGSAQALLYVNGPAIYPVIRAAAVKVQAGPGAKPNFFGINADTVMGSLGLDALGEAYAALRIDERESRLDSGLAYAEERGLLKLLAYRPGAQVRPEWVPAKWPIVSASRFSVPQAYEGLEELVESISPILSGMAQGQIRSLNQKLGLDLRRDLIGSLGDEFVTAYALPPGADNEAVPAWTEMDQFIAISLVNEEAFSRAVAALKQLAGPAADQMFTTRGYLGATIYTLNMPVRADAPPQRGLSYAIANRTLLLGMGSPATVESALQGMSSGRGGFWERDEVKSSLAGFPSGVAGIQVQDMRVMVASLIETAVRMQQAFDAEGKPDGEKKVFVDVSARPDAESIARHWGLASGFVTRTSEGLFGTTRLPHAQP